MINEHLISRMNDSQIYWLWSGLEDFLSEVDAQVPSGLEDVIPGYQDLCILRDELESVKKPLYDIID